MNPGARDRALGNDNGIDDSLGPADGSDQVRVVNARNGVVVHGGWSGTLGLFDASTTGVLPAAVENGARSLALAMAQTSTPFLNYGLKTRIEQWAATYAQVLGQGNQYVTTDIASYEQINPLRTMTGSDKI